MTDPRLDDVLAALLATPLDEQPDHYDGPDELTDNQADREYAEDADRAADRYEQERGH